MAVREAPRQAEFPLAATRRAQGRAWEAAAVLFLLLVAAAVRLPTLDQPLVESHGFRQTQTAYTALLFHEQGVDLLHPKLPVLGAPFEVPFEFPLFQALAAAPMSWGLSPDVAMRTTALACFLLSAVLLWGLVRHAGGRVAALAALAVYLFSPFSLLWSRASLIEYLAVAGALGWVWAGLLWRERRQSVYAVASLVAGVTAMLVKPTTAAFWLLPVLAFTAADERPGWRSWLRARRDPVLATLVVVPFLAALAWTAHADTIKAASPATAWLTSAKLSAWNLGTLHQRTVWGNWARILRRMTGELTGYPAMLLPLTALAGLGTRQARFWAAMAAVPVLTILCFWNLYVVHDYYLAAISPAPAAVAGVAIARLWHRVGTARARRALAGVLCTLVGGLVLLDSSQASIPYQAVNIAALLPEAGEVARLTSPADPLVFEGYNWSPVLPYYARRAGHMIVPDVQGGTTAAGLTAEGYRLLVSKHLESDLAVDVIRARRWTGVLGRWTYVTGDQVGDLRGAPVAATDDLVDAGPSVVAEPITITCGTERVALPRAPGATVLQVAPGTDPRAKLAIGEGYGDVPVRASVIVATPAPEAVLVGCRDAATVTIVAVRGAPPGSV